MAGGKLPPRQKMIGMMYLVLTALLAMNVSKDILNAFVTVNDGLEKTKYNFKDKNQAQYASFSASYAENPKKYETEYKKALEVQKMANEIVDYIDDIKIEIIAGIEPTIPKDKIQGKNEFGEDTILNLMNVKVKDNYLFSTQLLVGSEPSKPKTGEFTALSMVDKMTSFKELLNSMLEPGSAIDKAVNETFTFEDKKNASGVIENWPSYNFYGVPAAATITLLTKMQTDIRNAESDVIKYLLSKVDASTYKFTNLAPAIIPASNYVLQGDTFEARVFLAAFDTTMSPQIYLGDDYDSTTFKVTGDTIGVNVVKGNGMIKIPASAQGLFTYKGVIDFKGPTGEIEHYPYSINYQVAKPSTTISATKMNVFYIGVDNPVDISAAGVPKDKISASISSGTISKSADGWTVRVKKAGAANINVSAEVDGERQNLGGMEFRVKQIPTPIAKVASKTSGAIRKNALKATSGIRAELENFDFDVKVVVDSYVFGYTQANGLLAEERVKGNRFDGKIKGMFDRVKSNSKIYFEDIKVKMPDGTTRTLPPVTLKVI